jgi:tRNA-Thr(GGU) m(6)t(6)A37 methyltransferase TsaA
MSASLFAIGKLSRPHYHTGMDIVLHPVGWVHSSEHISAKGSREDFWGDVVSEIRLDESRFASDALEGLAEFSHVEVLFYLHGVSEAAVVSGRRHPRGNPKWPQVGIFAQRGKARPNRIAATVCRLLSVQGLSLKVQGLDAFDGSPVLDIKPVFVEFTPDRAAIRQPAWAHEMMADYFASGKI